MAVAGIKRQARIATRAWRRLLQRRISPVVAFRLFVRSCARITHALFLLALFIIGGGIVALLMVTTRLFFRAREYKASFKG